MGTWDAVLDTKPPNYRILHQAEGSEVYLLISESMASQEALKDWRWLEQEVLPTLETLEGPDQASEFVQVKVESLVALAREAPDGAEVEDQGRGGRRWTGLGPGCSQSDVYNIPEILKDQMVSILSLMYLK